MPDREFPCIDLSTIVTFKDYLALKKRITEGELKREALLAILQDDFPNILTFKAISTDADFVRTCQDVHERLAEKGVTYAPLFVEFQERQSKSTIPIRFNLSLLPTLIVPGVPTTAPEMIDHVNQQRLLMDDQMLFMWFIVTHGFNPRVPETIVSLGDVFIYGDQNLVPCFFRKPHPRVEMRPYGTSPLLAPPSTSGFLTFRRL